MKGWRGLLVVAVTLYMAAAAQTALGHLSFLGARVDYLLLVLAGLALFSQPRDAAIIGFFDGWMHASISGDRLWQHVLLRVLIAYGVARLIQAGIERSWVSAAIAGIAVVVLSRAGFMFLAPPSKIGPFLGDTLGTAVYNGVIAIPFYAVLNRIVGPRR